MIAENEVFKIGKLVKPHGVKGEITFAFDNDIFDKVDCPYLICLIDGIFVPFFIEEYRFKGQDTALVKFEDIGSEEEARRMNGLEVFFSRSFYEKSDRNDLGYSWSYFIGFTVVDGRYGEIGIVDAVDESTINFLFLVKKDEKEYLIPAAEDLIKKVDDKNKILKMDLPDGLLDC